MAILPKEHIEVAETMNNWQEATQLANNPLLKNQLIEQLYVDKMIQSVHDNGPYMVLAEYFALMHARPGKENGVNEQSMSMLVSKEPIDLAGKPVKIFFVLAAMDNSSHLQSLSEIMEIFMDSEKYERILACDKEEIIQIFQ